MSCQHPNEHPELPCPWPECPEGTPQQAVILLAGSEAAVRARPGTSLEVSSDGGAQLWRRRRTAGGWEWSLAL